MLWRSGSGSSSALFSREDAKIEGGEVWMEYIGFSHATNGSLALIPKSGRPVCSHISPGPFNLCCLNVYPTSMRFD